MSGVVTSIVPKSDGIWFLLTFSIFTNYCLAHFFPMDDLFVLCSSPPDFMLIEHNHIGACPFTSLSTDITPLYPIDSRSEVDSFSFVWSQISVCPGFAITNFKCQGRSVDKVVIDIKPSFKKNLQKQPDISHKIYTSLNVQLGRVRTLLGLWLRESITLEDVSYKPDPALHVEMERLLCLEKKTLDLWKQKSILWAV
jgi:hypothetical protein